MILEVKLPGVTRFSLTRIVRVQMDLLSCVVGLAGEGKALEEAAVRNYLNAHQGATRSSRLTNWLFETTEKPLGLLKKFVENNDGSIAGNDLLAEKRTIVEKMRQDVVGLYRRGNSDSLDCYFLVKVASTTGTVYDCCPDFVATHAFIKGKNQLPAWLSAMQEFLIYFYENLDQVSKALGTPMFGRQEYFAQFEKVNPNQYVCAICDEHRHMTVLRGAYFSDIEHYFPKTIYPHLCCHPYNLIPLCKPCNSAHKDKDPLLAPKGSRRKLGEIFLPYRSGSVEVQGAVKLDWGHTVLQPFLAIEAMTTGDADFAMKVGALSEIYDIPGRWQKRIHQIGDQLWRYIRQYLRVEVDQGEEIDLHRLRVELGQLMKYLFLDLGKTPWTYVLIWYLGNIIVEEVEQNLQKTGLVGPNPVLDTVKDILGEKDGMLARHATRVEEVIEKARALYGFEA